jgi:endonuclease/exonuclease/phosphatase family metal-dependent hydrolase
MNRCAPACRLIAAGLIAAAAWVSSLAAETLTIATYNLENYGSADRMTEQGYRQDYPKPEREKQSLRRVIVALDADVLVLQEIGSAAYLDELRRDLKRDGVDYPHAVLLDGPDADRHVGLLSKRAPVSVVQHRDLPFAYKGAMEKVKRGVLEVHFATDAGDLALFAVHLKSQYTDRADDPRSLQRRTAEAVAVRDLLLNRCPHPDTTRFLVLGDFNDNRISAALRRIEARGNTTISQLLPAADSRGETWTHAYRKEDSYSRLDHILVSPALWPEVAGGRASIFDGAGVADASDHRPVRVTLVFSPKAR